MTTVTTSALRPASKFASRWELPLDRGISYAVKVLRDAGIETFESCEGGDGHAFLEPTIRFHGGREEGFKALGYALATNLPVSEIRRFWQVIDGEPRGPHWEMTFTAQQLLRVQTEAEDARLIE